MHQLSSIKILKKKILISNTNIYHVIIIMILKYIYKSIDLKKKCL